MRSALHSQGHRLSAFAKCYNEWQKRQEKDIDRHNAHQSKMIFFP